VPTYADSHFTLAEVLRQQGRLHDAAKHESAYQEFSKADCLLAVRDEPMIRVVHFDDETRDEGR
jgi:hypothetical protein